MFPYGETVTRLRAFIAEDPYSGEEVAEDWSSAYELTIPGVAFVPGSSSEPTEDARNSVVTQPQILTLGDFPDVLAGDRILRAGVTYQVDGDPQAWDRHPLTGWAPGMAINLKHVEG